MKITARAARYLTGANRPARPLTPADVDAARCALYGPCATPDCPSCGGPRPQVALPFEPLDAEVTREITRAAARALIAEQRRAELDSCEDFGVDPRYV